MMGAENLQVWKEWAHFNRSGRVVGAFASGQADWIIYPGLHLLIVV
jgi:hypothetical protein